MKIFKDISHFPHFGLKISANALWTTFLRFLKKVRVWSFSKKDHIWDFFRSPKKDRIYDFFRSSKNDRIQDFYWKFS